MNPNIVIGYTDRETVKLDFDNTPFKDVKHWATRADNFHELGGFLTLKSSDNCYHVVFNRSVDWSENMRIVAWVCQQSKNYKLTGYLVMQCIKEASTLRVSPKGDKLSPRIVYRCGEEDIEIRNFLHYRRKIKDYIRVARAHLKPTILIHFGTCRKLSFSDFFSCARAMWY